MQYERKPGVARMSYGHVRRFLDEVAAHPVGLAWLAVVVIVISANGMSGYETGGNSIIAASVFVAIAVLGIWAGDERRVAVGARRTFLTGLLLMQLALGQYAGWQTLGLILSRGEGVMADKATSRTTLSETVSRLREERAALGTVRPIATIKAGEKLECGRVSKRYPDGVGPECTKLREELGKAERARRIEDELPALVARLGAGEKLTDAGAGHRVHIAVANSVSRFFGGRDVTSADIHFGLELFLVFVLEMIATLGRWMFGIGRHPVAREVPVYDDRFDPATLPRVPSALPPPPTLPRLSGSVSSSSAGGAPQPDHAAAGRPSGGSGGGAHASGAPITINLTSSPAGGFALPSADGAASARSASSHPQTRLPKPRSPRHDVGAQPAVDPPVDRQPVQEAVDGLLAFRAACVVDASGGLVAGDDLYRRYVAWRGARSLAEAAFHALFAELTGLAVADIAGVRHYRDVAMRAPQLQVAG